jgi:hypothetical protein
MDGIGEDFVRFVVLEAIQGSAHQRLEFGIGIHPHVIPAVRGGKAEQTHGPIFHAAL